MKLPLALEKRLDFYRPAAQEMVHALLTHHLTRISGYLILTLPSRVTTGWESMYLAGVVNVNTSLLPLGMMQVSHPSAMLTSHEAPTIF